MEKFRETKRKVELVTPFNGGIIIDGQVRVNVLASNKGNFTKEDKQIASLISKSNKMYEILIWLDMQGGLGNKKHDVIKEVINEVETSTL
ncbi:hypothetical protein [Myroides odoratus]|uniref:hypothetical protein n=1 Tax=Myroides odoratus TaxID=256 RepID=UPI003342090C